MTYDAWSEGYIKERQSKANKFDPNASIRFERVGNWIVSAKVLGGYKTVIYIYNAKTLMEHYKTEQVIGPATSPEATPEIKGFYQRAFNNAFQRVVDLANAWK